jgi:hypothetical protein
MLRGKIYLQLGYFIYQEDLKLIMNISNKNLIMK